MAVIYYYTFPRFEVWTGLSYAVLSQGLMWWSSDGDWGWRRFAGFLIRMCDGWRFSLQPGPSRRDPHPYLRVASCCVLGFLPEWRLGSKNKHAESKPDGSYSTCYDIASEVTQCHMCHIWLVRNESLSLVIFQDYWEISLHLLMWRVSKNRLRFKTTSTTHCLFLHHQTSFYSLSPFYKWL